MIYAMLLTVILMVTPAAAQSFWTVDYSVRGDISQVNQFYGQGAYLFLKTPTSDIPVYLQAGGWQFQGMYGQVPIPDRIPQMVFTGTFDQAVAHQEATVAVPELALLRLPRHIYGRELGARLNPPLQQITAWGATGLLRAIGLPAVQHGIYVDLPKASLEVQEWCSGLTSAKWLLLFGLGFVAIGRLRIIFPTPWKWALLLLIAAPLIAIESNILRVAGYGVVIEMLGAEARHGMAKEWLGWAALAFAVTQLVGLHWLIGAMERRAVYA
jgi:exosortase